MTDTPDIEGGDNARAIAVGELRAFVERVERLETEKQAYSDDIKEVYAEAKSSGFDTKTLRAIIRLRRKEPEKVSEEMALLQVYADALGLGIFG